MKKYVAYNFILLFALLGLAFHFRNSISPEQVVYNYCNNSRISDMTSEQTCGDLQDFYHVEFLCEDLNKLTTNHCWVEKI